MQVIIFFITKHLKWFFIVLLLYNFYKLFKTDKDVQKKEEANDSSLSDSKANELSEILYSSMNRFGTDEDAIEAVFKGLNGRDYAKIYNAFGLKSYESEVGYEVFGDYGSKFSLTEMLVSELSNFYVSKYKAQFGSSFI